MQPQPASRRSGATAPGEQAEGERVEGVERARPAERETGVVAAFKRALLLAAMSAVTLNVWTGSPLAAVWIGSRFQGSGPPAMLPIFVVAGCLAAFSFVLLRILGWLGSAYDRMSGRPPMIRQHVPWLRSMRGERPKEQGDDYSLSALEILLCATVILVLVVFEYWFFFLSTSSIDSRSGRG